MINRPPRALVRMYGCLGRSAITIKGMTSDETARHRADQRQSARDSSAVLMTVIIASAVVAIALVAAVVALSIAGREPSVIIGLVGPVAAAAAVVIAALGKLVAVDRKQDRQTAKIDQVAHQTNGALRAHITKSIEEGLTARIGPRPAPAPTPPARKAHK